MVRNVDFFCLMVVALRFLTRGINLLAGALLTHYNSELEAARAHVINLVNTFFRAKLEGVPTIREYIEQMQQH